MTPGLTATPGLLKVAAAFPDPPFDVTDRPPTGFDIDLMQAVAEALGLRCAFTAYEGDGFEGIFAGLGGRPLGCRGLGRHGDRAAPRAGDCSAVPMSVPARAWSSTWRAIPDVRSIDDLAGRSLGVQHGNTSEPVAQRLLAERKVGSVRTYAYHDIPVALDDLEAGRLDAFMKLEPVIRWLIRTGLTSAWSRPG